MPKFPNGNHKHCSSIKLAESKGHFSKALERRIRFNSLPLRFSLALRFSLEFASIRLHCGFRLHSLDCADMDWIVWKKTQNTTCMTMCWCKAGYTGCWPARYTGFENYCGHAVITRYISGSSHFLNNSLFIGSMPAVEADTQSQTVLHGDTQIGCGVMSRFVHECWEFGVCRRPAAGSRQ